MSRNERQAIRSRLYAASLSAALDLLAAPFAPRSALVPIRVTRPTLAELHARRALAKPRYDKANPFHVDF